MALTTTAVTTQGTALRKKTKMHSRTWRLTLAARARQCEGIGRVSR